MEMKEGHASIRRGVSWSPGEQRKPIQATQDMHTPGTECNALWEKTGFNKEHMSRRTSKCLFIWHLCLYLWSPSSGMKVLLCDSVTLTHAVMLQFSLNCCLPYSQEP